MIDTIPKKRILIVEDEPGLRHAYQIVLEAHGYEVTTASDGEEGLICLRKTPPDLILLDMLMPKLDGLGFMKQADLTEAYPDTRVIAFSNLSDSKRMTELRRLGASHQVLKADVNPRELVELIERTLRDEAD